MLACTYVTTHSSILNIICEYVLHILSPPHEHLWAAISHQAIQVHQVRMSRVLTITKHSILWMTAYFLFMNTCGVTRCQVHQVRPFTNHYTITPFRVSVAVHPTEVTRSNSDLVQSTAHCIITLVMSTRLAILFCHYQSTFVNEYSSVYTSSQNSANSHERTRTHACTHTHTHTHAHTRAHTHTHTHTRTHTRAHTHIHTHILLYPS